MTPVADDCTTCRYSQVDQNTDTDGGALRCHRHPPVVVAVIGGVAQAWPNVGPGEWCGEHTGHGPGGP